jgi:hypothetical protein
MSYYTYRQIIVRTPIVFIARLIIADTADCIIMQAFLFANNIKYKQFYFSHFYKCLTNYETMNELINIYQKTIEIYHKKRKRNIFI